MRCLLSLSLVLPACGFSGSGTVPAEDLPEPPLCLQGFVSFCVDEPPTRDLSFTGTTAIDTATSPECAPLTLTSGGDLCVIFARNLTIETGATLRAFGARPLALIATSALTVRGDVEVSSSRLTPGEPGAGSRTCAHMRAPEADTGGAAGGAGGSMAFSGGEGGEGDRDNDGADDNALQGLPGATTARPATALVGGCQGQQGATGIDPGGSGGSGGGAVYLRGASINLASNSAVRAGGAGGNRGLKESGGGGGGSGGVIMLETPALTPSGILLATGGGGGGGGDINVNGGPGDDATSTQQAAAGGSMTGAGGDGGNGGTTGVGAPASGANGGGGGGGGGTGYILYLGPELSAGAFVNAVPTPVRM